MITVLLISLGAFVATYVGGMFAIHLKDKLHLILGFSAGALVFVAFKDLLPESLEIGIRYHSIGVMTTWVAAGVLTYMILDRFLHTHPHQDPHNDTKQSDEHGKNGIGPLSLVIHSVFDGVAIGLASLVPATLPIVAAAVLAHDFSDGINTVNLVFRNEGKTTKARVWLFLDAIAPIVGALTTRLFTIPESVIGVVLAVLAGFFMYIGLSDLVPESYHRHSTYWTTIATIVGAAVIFVAVHFAGI
jgi:ZIP family zinc transporter